ncbi:sulfatase [Paenibacillus sp. TAB 01]|uniref:sulfatase family protein n=1 Tax=Paenibacillus sp. TAB 01 TaxID=3368988 RepID=UPI0037508AC7
MQNDYKVGGADKLSDDEIRRIRVAYYGSVTQTDTQIGRILDQLEALNLRENTLVILTADHGEMLGDHHSFGKRTFYEASNRIPLVLSWPAALPQGESREQLAVLEDVYATILSAAGASLPDGCAGVNLLPSAQELRSRDARRGVRRIRAGGHAQIHETLGALQIYVSYERGARSVV